MDDDKQSTDTYKIFISGRVQGIGYRKFVKDLANQLGYDGYVKNISDNSVQVMIAIDAQSLDDFISNLKTGNTLADVKNISINKVPRKLYFSGFHIQL